MPITGIETDTGLAPLPDVGTLAYNGVTFSSLFKSNCSGVTMPDQAGRTVRFVEWTIVVEGYVTLQSKNPAGGVVGGLGTPTTIDATMTNLRQLLEAYGGTLTYEGKGLGNVTVNDPNGVLWDTNWGPKPKVLDFQPLGGSRAALVKWQVVVCIPELSQTILKDILNRNLQAGKASGLRAGPASGRGPVVQFNEETSVTYDEDCYSTLTIKGTLEIPLTRRTQDTFTVFETVDNYRELYMNRVAQSVDLTRFRVTKRDFTVSRDKRTMEWTFVAEELPPMGLPPGAVAARGKMTVRPLDNNPALVNWYCTLTGTYTIRKDFPRRLAWAAFLSLLKFRMEQSVLGNPPPNPPQPNANPALQKALGGVVWTNPLAASIMKRFLANQQQQGKGPALQNAMIYYFTFTEGLYLDSKTITFECSWRLITTFSHILLASGVWRTADLEGGIGLLVGGAGVAAFQNLWSQSVRDIQGAQGNLFNQLDPAAQAIVDLGNS
jgi:hypothetical protein